MNTAISTVVSISLLFIFEKPCIIAEEPPSLKLTVKTDKLRYNLDDTIVVAAEFKGLKKANIQIAPGTGSAYFYLILQSVDRLNADGKGHVVCRPAWDLQLVGKQFTKQEPKSSLITVSWGFKHQLSLLLGCIVELPPGEYTLRIGYCLHGRALDKPVSEATGVDTTVDPIGDTILKDAYEEPLLSEPITITIGPAQEKKK